MNIPSIALAGLILAAPPFDGPPAEPLVRYEPRMYDLKYDVMLNTQLLYGQDDPRVPNDVKHPRSTQFGGTFMLEDAPIVMPLVIEGAYHQIARDSLYAELWLQNKQDTSLKERFRLDDGLPYDGHLAVLPIVRFRGTYLRWQVAYRMQSFSSEINDQQAATIAWPREWPDEVKTALQPQLYIESNEPIFGETVQRISEGNLRLVPPYLAVKDIVRYCINEVQMTGSTVHRGRAGVLHGMNVSGALVTATEGRGSPNDLVCVCVAMLRAAGIPARPVIGIEETDTGRKTLITWAEFFLPDTGWVPFDPVVMRGKGIRTRDVRQSWPEFGTMDDLNRRVPLAYHFMPPRAVISPQYPAVWGWDPRPQGAPNHEQIITITVISRGRGVTDEEQQDG